MFSIPYLTGIASRGREPHSEISGRALFIAKETFENMAPERGRMFIS